MPTCRGALYAGDLRPGIAVRLMRERDMLLDPAQRMTIVAAQAGVICGFATTAPARDADTPEHGELCALYVDPDWWGRGVGVWWATLVRSASTGTTGGLGMARAEQTRCGA